MLALVRSLSEEVEADDEEAAVPSIRQLITNTPSPLVVAELRDDELLFVETLKQKGKAFVNFKPLPESWRQGISGATGAELLSRGEIVSYLSGRKSSNRSVRQNSLVGRLDESSTEGVKTPTTPDLFQRAPT